MRCEGWRSSRIVDMVSFSPRETLPKNKLAKKVAMEKLSPFQKAIDGFELNNFNGGTKFRNGDTLLARITPCLENGKTAKVSILEEGEVGFGSSEYIVMRNKPGITDADFVYYLATSPAFRELAIKSMVGTSGRQRVQQDLIESAVMSFPPLPEQRAIAATLSCLDDKIELNNRMNKTLEEMAQAIFKSWFVDFEPFQDGEFVDSELGRIPKGWRVGVLDECIELYDYKRIPLSSRERASMDKLYPYYGATSLMDYVNDFIFDGVYVLLGEDGSVVDSEGYPILQYVWGKFWVNNHAHILKGRNGYDEQSIYMLLKNTNVQSIVTGAVQLKINQANLKSVRVLIPDESTLKRFNMMVFDVFQLKRQLREESDLLVSTRDILLPKLMSGEICVSALMEV